MLIPKDQPEMICTTANEKQILLDKVTNTEINRKYVRDYKERKCIFAKIFGDKK
jgi:hypothetical protein